QLLPPGARVPPAHERREEAQARARDERRGAARPGNQVDDPVRSHGLPSDRSHRRRARQRALRAASPKVRLPQRPILSNVMNAKEAPPEAVLEEGAEEERVDVEAEAESSDDDQGIGAR